MKSLVIAILALFLSLDSSAQQEKPLPKPGATYEDPWLDQFEGEWATKAGKSEKIKFYLWKEKRTYQANITSTVLAGYHEFEKNGKTIDSSFERKDADTGAHRKSSVALSRSGRPDELGGFLTEQVSGKRSMILAKYHPASETLVVTLHESGGLVFNQPRKERLLPERFVLKRVK